LHSVHQKDKGKSGCYEEESGEHVQHLVNTHYNISPAIWQLLDLNNSLHHRFLEENVFLNANSIVDPQVEEV